MIVPSASAREGARAARGSNTRLWRTFVAFALFMWLVYMLIPRSHEILRNAVVYPLTEATALAAAYAGIRRYRPPAPGAWLWIVAGFTTTLIADLVWAGYLFADRSPFPSPADFFYLAAYPVVAVGLLIAIRRRGAVLDARAWLDAGMLAVVAGLFCWIFLAVPTIDDPSLSTWETVISIGYPACDLLLLVVAVRFLLGGEWRVRSIELLVAALACTLAGDILFQLSLTAREGAVYTGDGVLLLGIICLGAACLHETMPALTEEAPEPHGEESQTVRVLLLAVACLTPLIVLAFEAARDKPLHTPSIVVTMALIAILAIARADVVADRALRAAKREAVLSGYANELLRSNGEEELYAVAARTASHLVDDGQAALLATDASDAQTHAFAVPVSVNGERVGDLVADASPRTILRARDSLATVADELSLALDRERLLYLERETAATLAEQNEQLRELDKMKDQFVSTVTHELRTPLTSMLGYLEILAGEEGEDLDPEEQKHFLEIVNRNCQRLNVLVDDILAAARIDSGRFKLERTTVDLAALASERIESIQAMAEQGQVEVRLTVEQAPPPLFADSMRLGQLLDNLLSNAVKFTPAEGVVDVKLSMREDTVHIEVSDTGVGIPDDELDKLFDRFFRASTAATVKGTGLGLSIAKAIVEAHGGAISVSSEVGAGTTFHVELPVVSPEEAAAAETAEAAK